MSLESSRRFKKTVLPAVLVLLGFAGVLVAVNSKSKVPTSAPKFEPPVVRVQQLSSESWQFIVRAHGSVAPRSESNLIPQVSGAVVWVSPSLVSGGFFEAGEPLLRIDPSDYEVNLETALATVERGKSEHLRANKELERQKRLAKSSAASAAAYDDAVNREVVSGATLREFGVSLAEAVKDAGVARFRPTVLTPLTTFVGLTPLLFERSVSAQFLIPMAISLAFGVAFATVVTLFLVPSGYVILEDMKKLKRKGLGKDDPVDTDDDRADVVSIGSSRAAG